jgi:hypothetical protein
MFFKVFNNTFPFKENFVKKKKKKEKKQEGKKGLRKVLI